MGRLWHFLSYNNAVPVAVAVLISGAGATFAATNPETLYDATETVIAIDNTYIADKDLDNYSPRLEIRGVTEDDENYYVAYRLQTIDIADAVWQDVSKDGVLTVAKAVLGEYGDLGLYATEQFKQIVDRQIAYLKEVQDIERRQISRKMVATSYSGLVGRFLDDSTETLPGYEPVVTPPPEPEVQPEPQPEPQPDQTEHPVQNELPTTPTGTSSNAPTVQILGDVIVHVAIGGTYTDLGVVVTDDTDDNPELQTFVNGNPAEGEVSIDTSTAGSWDIRYTATDSDTNQSSVNRTVIVEAPATEPGSGSSEGTASTSTPSQPETPPSTQPETPTEAPVGQPPTAEPPAAESVPTVEPAPTPEPEPFPTPAPGA